MMSNSDARKRLAESIARLEAPRGDECDSMRETLIDFAVWNGDTREDAEWAAETYLNECATLTPSPRTTPPTEDRA